MEKQIEEIAKVLGEIQEFGINRPRDGERYPVLYPSNKEVADYLISKGYRRASYVARAFFEDIRNIWKQGRGFIKYTDLVDLERIYEKKYESEDR